MEQTRKPSFFPFLICVFTGVLITGCVRTHEVTGPDAAGTFSGSTDDGRALVLTLERTDVGFSGRGTLDGKSFVLSGAQTWTGVGAVAYGDGSIGLVSLGLSPDGSTLNYQLSGQGPTALARGGTPVAPQVPGPFSGRFAAAEGELPLAVITVKQSNALITGVGRILGQAAGITGRVTAARRAAGVITFTDESQASFEAELSSDGQSLTILGLGAPLVLERA